ncbi:MAG TPA: di-heme oxidoredictase family protein [Candidatus Acidoferrales bacterium]|nr:di-heme oxidoredictase family protein [Candidatus Acidoferrales bacterium]
MIKTARLASSFTLAVLLLLGAAFAQTDPGVQSGNRGTGAALPSVLSNSPSGILAFFTDGQARFQEVESVSGGANNGLGPRFNSNSCSSCHGQPAIGGTGAAVNPQFQFTSDGVAPRDTTPSFITANGPTREARFPFFFNSNGSVNTNAPNGGVEDLFTVTGRSDAGSCSLSQPSFAAAQQANDIIFRIPTPVFGAGLIENLDESTLLKNTAANNNNRLGISGTLNHNGNDGTITRFGWKAQNKSLHIFAGEAYNVEMGISNLLFPQDRPLPGEEGGGGSGLTGFPATCLNLSGGGYPEDANNPGSAGAAVLDDVSAFANFMRTLAPPPTGGVVLNGQQVPSQTIAAGSSLFSAIGCATCHNSTVGSTQKSNITSSLSNAPVNAFSDLEIHHMGTGLADNVSQGGAGGDQFRTAPLWGLGQRIFLLHDGRTTNLNAAIEAHQSSGSEATTVEENFHNLTTTQQQEILDFLRSL